MIVRILDKYLYKELLLTLLAVLLVLLLIVFGTEATRLLAMAVEGKLSSAILGQVLLLQLPAALEMVLPLVVLLSVLIAFGRWYQDREMVVLQACAVSPGYLQQRLIWFLVPVAIALAFVSLLLTPWAVKQERELIYLASVQAPLAGLVAGRFNSLPQGQGVLYAQRIESDGQMQQVWLQQQTSEGDRLVMAPNARFEWIDDRLALVLLDGWAYEGVVRGETLRVRQFERFEGFLPALPVPNMTPLQEEMTITELWHAGTPEAMALLQWRLVLPLSVLVLGLVAWRMSKTDPRQGRFGKIFLAIFIYILYLQLLFTFNSWVRQGIWPALPGLFIVPAMTLFLLWLLPRLRVIRRLA
ncbi:LPS export ABC transporter permease LptF [Thiomicrospira cyclica]|uniref:Lipopolysaccharide export system permease protein LptF n=1 Tax=Thiomicrospira cyclica (strain DSM 14477 / JCM 11371 / ALM1) TaxID=717773 RepID=F6DA61_THICA|nr:LPS export ABC transporter permease LptF [Thiomicrospira cyclica]AEG32192.1 permease YjgP/YjgQ family protein [Thiomicrospira cyclica ALM1]